MDNLLRHIEDNKYPLRQTNRWWDESSLYHIDITQRNKSFIDLSVPAISLIRLLSPKNEFDLYSRCSSLSYDSAQLFEKINDYQNQDFFFSSYTVNEVHQNINEIEIKISSELKFLHNLEAKWKSLFDFTEEYKKVFEISDEELWFEYGDELNNYVYEINTITQAKLLIDKSKNYLKRTKWIIYYLAYRYTSNQKSGLRHLIAFSTKNLDDEHHSEVKIMRNNLSKLPELVLYEKEKYYKPFVLYLS